MRTTLTNMLTYLFLAALMTLLPAQDRSVIEINEGRSKTVTIPPQSRVVIGDPGIATALATRRGGLVNITGHRAGQTSLTIYMSNGQFQEKVIRVRKDAASTIREIEEIFAGVEGVTFAARRDEVVAEGAVYTRADLERYEMILSRYPHIIDLVEDKSEKLLVNISVEFIEVTLSTGTDFNNGIPLPQGTGNFFAANGLKPQWSFEGQIANVLDRVAYWKTQGQAKIIANPTLTVTDSDTATFLAGGEIPVPVPSGLGTVGIEYREFGVKLDILPKMMESGKIMIDLDAEVSTVDFSNRETNTGAPVLLSRKVSSRGIVDEGGTVSLAGIYQKSIIKNKKRVPVLGWILPFIFSSVTETEEVKELIVLVTPRTPVDFDIENYPLLKKELSILKGAHDGVSGN